MAIDSLGSNAAVNYSQFSGAAPVPSRVQDSGDAGAAGAARPPASGGKFVDAIAQALAQVGGTATASADASAAGAGASGADAGQAEAAFAQSLFSALQSQAGGQAGAQSGAPAQGASGGHHHHHGGGGGGKIASGLQQLAQQATASASAGGDAAGAASPALGDLQTSFDNLLAANNQSGTSATLPQFLQALSQNLQGASSSGNVVSTKA